MYIHTNDGVPSSLTLCVVVSVVWSCMQLTLCWVTKHTWMALRVLRPALCIASSRGGLCTRRACCHPNDCQEEHCVVAAAPAGRGIACHSGVLSGEFVVAWSLESSVSLSLRSAQRKAAGEVRSATGADC